MGKGTGGWKGCIIDVDLRGMQWGATDVRVDVGNI